MDGGAVRDRCQSQGTDTSIEAFLRWSDQRRAQAVAATVGGSGTMPRELLPLTLNAQVNGSDTQRAGGNFSTIPLPFRR